MIEAENFFKKHSKKTLLALIHAECCNFFGNDLSEVTQDHLVLIPAHNMLFILLLFLIAQ